MTSQRTGSAPPVALSRTARKRPQRESFRVTPSGGKCTASFTTGGSAGLARLWKACSAGGAGSESGRTGSGSRRAGSGGEQFEHIVK